MADEARKISNSPSPLENVDDLPLPPPLPIPSRPLDHEGPLALSSLPVPPPKETFSTFYQKQQRNELKRIIKHVDPHLQFKLSHVEDDEITKAIQSENSSTAEAAYQGDVQSMRWIFENWNLDNIGEPRAAVKTLDDEELTGGDVRGTSLAFKHLDSNQQILAKRQISHSGDVRTSTWLFETRPLDSLSKSESEEGELVVAVLREPIQPGDVTGTRLLFESKPLSELGRHNSNEDNLLLNPKSEREECKDDGILGEVKSVGREKANGGNVNHVRRLYETQPLNGINKESDGKSQTLALEEGPSGGVEQKRLMFDTQPFDTIQHNVELENFEPSVAECASNVSQVKELFTLQSLNEIGSEITTSSADQIRREMSLTDQETDDKNSHKATDAERSNVHDKKSIFETFSLDKINQEPIEQTSVEAEEPVSKVDVKSSTMMFESMPMYAIRDKEGEFHEVTTLKKEEVTSGDVRKARWMFETKPLDAIRAENDVYVIRAVTQEERQKGDVKSARWKFETQPLDSITSHEEPFVKVTEDPGSGSGQLADRHTLESKQSSKQFVRTASVTDIQSGRVRTSTWLFENQPIESLKGEPEQQVPLKAVQRQDSRRGDVKRCTWLFESQPLEKIKETGESSRSTVEGKLPCSNVKSTTWLFETTPLDKINVGSATDSLSSLHKMSYVHSNGILIEASENKNLIMVKYQVDNDEDVQIQKEEVIAGDIRNTMLQLLQSTTPNPQVILLREVEEGKFTKTVVQSPGCQFATTTSVGNDRVQNIIQMIDEMLVQEKALKKGILMQVTEDGQAEMSVYSLIGNNGTKAESPIVERGDVKSAIGNLFSSANAQRVSPSCRVDETEKGNVSLYKNVIEKEDEVGHCSKEQIPVVKGDVEEAKRSLCQQKDQIEKTVCDVLPGDVQNTKKIFSSSYSFSVDNCIPKEEIIPGDVSSAKQQLAVRPAVEVEKEEIIAGNIKDAMQSLELAKQQSVCIGREPIKPGTIYDMDQSAQGPDVEEIPVQKEVIISGDIKAAKRSLEMAKQQSMHTDRKTVVPGDIYNLCASAQDNSSSTGCPSASRCQQVKAVPKFQLPAKELCAACLTPVYQMEKMVANQLILHNKCFCCKHCRKKLSIHNFSLLRGEIYCPAHYQQHFKRGNSAEGLKPKQCKDHSLLKTNGTNEPDVVSIPKTAKSKNAILGGAVDVTRRIATTWPPPETKRTPGNNMSWKSSTETVKRVVPGYSKADRENLIPAGNVNLKKQLEITKRQQADKKEKMVKGCTKTPWVSPAAMSYPKSTVTSQETAQEKVTPVINTNCNLRVEKTEKTKRVVRFSPDVDVAQYEQIQPDKIPDVEKEMLLEKPKHVQVNRFDNMTDKMNNPAPDLSNKDEPLKTSRKSPEESNTKTQQESGVEAQGCRDRPQTNLTLLEDAETVEEPQVIKHLSDPFETTQDNVTGQGLDEKQAVSLKSSNDLNVPQGSAEQILEVESNKDDHDKNNLTIVQANEDSQKKIAARTEPPKTCANHSEKSKAKLSSWSKGKSPLLKFFMSYERINKTEVKDAKKPDVKPSGGTPQEKTEDLTKSGLQKKPREYNKNTGEVTENVGEGKDNNHLTQVSNFKQGLQKSVQESNTTEAKTIESQKDESLPANLQKTSAGNCHDDPKGDQESMFPGKTEDKDVIFTTPPTQPTPEKPITHLTGDKSKKVDAINDQGDSDTCVEMPQRVFGSPEGEVKHFVHEELLDHDHDQIIIDTIKNDVRSVTANPTVNKMKSEGCIQTKEKMFDLNTGEGNDKHGQVNADILNDYVISVYDDSPANQIDQGVCSEKPLDVFDSPEAQGILEHESSDALLVDQTKGEVCPTMPPDLLNTEESHPIQRLSPDSSVLFGPILDSPADIVSSFVTVPDSKPIIQIQEELTPVSTDQQTAPPTQDENPTSKSFTAIAANDVDIVGLDNFFTQPTEKASEVNDIVHGTQEPFKTFDKSPEESNARTQQESEVEAQSCQERSQTELTLLEGHAETVEESQVIKHLSDPFETTQDNVTGRGLDETQAVSVESSKDLNVPQGSAEQILEVESNKDDHGKNNLTIVQANEDSQKKIAATTEPPKTCANHSEKPKAKQSLWSKGKSPLLKLFMSHGAERINKTEVKDAKKPDVKPSGGTPQVKTEDLTKSGLQKKPREHNKNTGEVTENVGEGKDNSYLTQVSNFLQKSVQKSNATKAKTIESQKDEGLLGNLQKTSAGNCHDDPKGDRESMFPGKTEDKDVIFATPPTQPTPEKSFTDLYNGEEKNNHDQRNADIFNDNVMSVSDEPLANQINEEVCSKKPPDMFNSPEAQVDQTNGEVCPTKPPDLLDTKESDPIHRLSPDSSVLFGPILDSPADIISSTVSVLNSKPIIQMQEELTPVLTDQQTAPPSQDENPTSKPFTAIAANDLDIFGLDNVFTQPTEKASDVGGDAFTTPSSISPDIFAVNDIYHGTDASEATSNAIQSDLDAFFSTPVSQINVYADDSLFSDSFLVAESKTTGQEETKSTGSNMSWLDELLG